MILLVLGGFVNSKSISVSGFTSDDYWGFGFGVGLDFARHSSWLVCLMRIINWWVVCNHVEGSYSVLHLIIHEIFFRKAEKFKCFSVSR